MIIHRLEMMRLWQDEARLVCAACAYVRAVPLTLDGDVDCFGHIIVEGQPGVAHPRMDKYPPGNGSVFDVGR